MPIYNLTRNTTLAQQFKTADHFSSRMVGLLNRKSLPEDEALIITRCNSIHMFFMKFSIDVIFLDGGKHVVGLVRAIKPFGLSPIFFKACYAIELAVGVIDQTKTAIGDKINW